nr:retrovirus-related Pol polyprotein from transposon TNT 1-94 [Ipomoea batatas]
MKFGFLGFLAAIKGYILYDLANKIIIVSREVIFYEQVFPLKQGVLGADHGSDTSQEFDPSLPLIPIETEPTPIATDQSFLGNNSPEVATEPQSEGHILKDVDNQPQITRSTRARTIPHRLQDYLCQSTKAYKIVTHIDKSVSAHMSYEIIGKREY